MRYCIYTRIYKDGEIFTDTPNTDFITALGYIKADRLTEIEIASVSDAMGQATLIFGGHGRRSSYSLAADFIRPGAGGGTDRLLAYDLETHIIWGDEILARDQKIDFLEILAYMRLNECEIIDRTRGNLAENRMTFYSNFAGRKKTENRIEVIIRPENH